jgi:hypothetical protein
VRNQCRIRFSLIHDLPSALAGIIIMKRTPREFAAFLAAEARKWPPILKASGVKPE